MVAAEPRTPEALATSSWNEDLSIVVVTGTNVVVSNPSVVVTSSVSGLAPESLSSSRLRRMKNPRTAAMRVTTTAIAGDAARGGGVLPGRPTRRGASLMRGVLPRLRWQHRRGGPAGDGPEADGASARRGGRSRAHPDARGRRSALDSTPRPNTGSAHGSASPSRRPTSTIPARSRGWPFHDRSMPPGQPARPAHLIQGSSGLEAPTAAERPVARVQPRWVPDGRSCSGWQVVPARARPRSPSGSSS